MRTILTWLALCAAMATAAFLVGRGFRSPAQLSSAGRPARPALLTAPLRLTRARASVVFRASASELGTFGIPAPSAPAGSLPVVTALNVRAGSLVGAGSVPFAVALRPVIVLPGLIPAFRAMSYGDSGVDVSELQGALLRLGYSIAPDSAGTYGLGTARAVASLYRAVGYAPSAVPVTQGAGRHRTTVQAASVPLGEVVFVPSLPRTVVRVSVHLGSDLASRHDPEAPLVQLGTGRVLLRGEIDQSTRSLLAVGERGVAISDLSGLRVPVRIAALHRVDAGGAAPAIAVMLSPDGADGAALVGQNVAVRISVGPRRRAATWLVPTSAVYTDSGGASFIVVVQAGRQHRVAVRPGEVVGGTEIIDPLSARLTPGEPVVVGLSGS